MNGLFRLSTARHAWLRRASTISWLWCRMHAVAHRYNQSKWHCIYHKHKFSSNNSTTYRRLVIDCRWRNHMSRVPATIQLPRVCSMYVTRITYATAINGDLSVQHQKCVVLISLCVFFCFALLLSGYLWNALYAFFPDKNLEEERKKNNNNNTETDVKHLIRLFFKTIKLTFIVMFFHAIVCIAITYFHSLYVYAFYCLGNMHSAHIEHTHTVFTTQVYVATIPFAPLENVIDLHIEWSELQRPKLLLSFSFAPWNESGYSVCGGICSMRWCTTSFLPCQTYGLFYFNGKNFLFIFVSFTSLFVGLLQP